MMPEIVKRYATKEHALNALQAALLGIPYGASFERLLFGHATEARMNRIETTLKEVAEILSREASQPEIDGNEDLANLIEDVIPALGRATSETKRKMFRDLLLNASHVPMGDPRWEEANLAAKTIDEITPFGLELIAAFYHCITPYANVCCLRPNKIGYEVGLRADLDHFSLAKPFDEDTELVQVSNQSQYILWSTMDSLLEKDILDYRRDSYLCRDVVFHHLGEFLVMWVIRAEDGECLETDNPDGANKDRGSTPSDQGVTP